VLRCNNAVSVIPVTKVARTSVMNIDRPADATFHFLVTNIKSQHINQAPCEKPTNSVGG
jgi:hypothetical protein